MSLKIRKRWGGGSGKSGIVCRGRNDPVCAGKLFDTRLSRDNDVETVPSLRRLSSRPGTG